MLGGGRLVFLPVKEDPVFLLLVLHVLGVAVLQRLISFLPERFPELLE